MSRCPFYTESKYAYQKKKKQCLQVASEKVVFPTENFATSMELGFTKVTFAWICAGHASAIRHAKEDQIKNWKAREAEIHALVARQDN